MSALEIEVPLQPKQVKLWEFFDDTVHSRIGMGGSRGGAKSAGARAVMMLRRLKYPRTRGMIFRRKFKDLWENHIEKYFSQWPFLRGWYHTQNKEITLPNGSVIAFRYAEHEKDIDDFLGIEYMDICIDEATQLSERSLVKFEGSNRWTALPHAVCKILHTTNPGGPGHEYLRRIYLKRQYRGEERESDYAFIASRAWDNVYWAEKALADANLSDKDYYSWTDAQRFDFFIGKTQYGRQLNSLPKGLRLGWLLGDWDLFAGQYFSVFLEERHTREPQELKLKAWWPRWGSLDWGYQHPSCFHKHAKDGDRVVTYGELYGAGIGEYELGRRIADACKGERLRHLFISPDAFAKRGSANTIAEQVSEGIRDRVREINAEEDEESPRTQVPSCEVADDDRIGGARLMHEMLTADLWTISKACPKLIECLPMLIHDEDRPEDVLKVDATESAMGDDPYDSSRYGLKTMLAPGSKPLAERVTEKVEAYAESRNTTTEDMDPHTIATLSRRATFIERQKRPHGFRKPIWHPRHVQ